MSQLRVCCDQRPLHHPPTPIHALVWRVELLDLDAQHNYAAPRPPGWPGMCGARRTGGLQLACLGECAIRVHALHPVVRRHFGSFEVVCGTRGAGVQVSGGASAPGACQQCV